MPSLPAVPAAPDVSVLPQAARGRFFVLIGPSGAGKSTLMRHYLLAHPEVARCISATTRAPRGDEIDGRDYWFLDEAEFARRQTAGEFLEWATVFGRASYGTPQRFVMERLAAGQDVIKDVDVQGAGQIRRSLPEAVQIFVAPSSLAEVERRLRARATDSESSIARRLAEATHELAYWPLADYMLVNDDLDRAAEDLAAIIRAERLRTAARRT